MPILYQKARFSGMTKLDAIVVLEDSERFPDRRFDGHDAFNPEVAGGNKSTS
jgi:hypothetical protein